MTIAKSTRRQRSAGRGQERSLSLRRAGPWPVHYHLTAVVGAVLSTVAALARQARAQLLTASNTSASIIFGVGYKTGEPVATEISARASVGPSSMNLTM